MKDVTKPHKVSHKKELSTEQKNAIDLLVQGKTDQETAEGVGVTRETVCRWRNDHFFFTAELNKQRKAVWQSAQDSLRALVTRAVKTLETSMENGDVKAAVEVLKAVRLYGEVTAPEGHEDPYLVMRTKAENLAEQELSKAGKLPFYASLSIGTDPYEAEKKSLTREKMEELMDLWFKEFDH